MLRHGTVLLVVAVIATACGPTDPPPPPPRPVAPAPPPPAPAIGRGMVAAESAPVHLGPSASSPIRGYARWGARFDLLERKEDAGVVWWRLRDVGWVRDASLKTKTDGTEPRGGFIPIQPRLDRPMPYMVGRVLAEDGTPVFRRPPREGEKEDSLVMRRLSKGYFFTIDRITSVRRRPWFRGINYWFIPRDETTTTIVAPTFEGIPVTEETRLPFLWVTDPTAKLCPSALAPGDPASARCVAVARHSRIPYSGETRVAGGLWYQSGSRFIASPQVARVARIASPPAGVGPNEHWIHVDLRNQFAGLYEGTTLRFVTLVSSGDDEHRTPPGTYRVLSRHVTATMDGENNPSGPYFIQDVPWVMYFHQGYALHAAFWHDRFGLRTSHGCVNLSPSDARRFFEFASTPALPPGLHSAYTQPDERGTLVHITN